MRILCVMITVFAVLLSGNVTAGELSYTCKVAHLYALSANGALESSGFEKQMKGGTFSVSRVTGEIIGEVVPTALAQSTRVVNEGSSENSFKAVADFGGQYQVLEVQEYQSGAIKPFIALSMGGAGIVTGTCQ